MASASNLPPELVHLIIDHQLTPPDLQQLSLTNKSMYETLKANEKQIWLMLLQRDYLEKSKIDPSSSSRDLKKLYFTCKNAIDSINKYRKTKSWYEQLPFVLQNSKQFLLKCASVWSVAKDVIPETFLKEKSFVLDLIEASTTSDNPKDSILFYVYDFDYLRDDYDVVKAAIEKISCNEYTYASDRLKADKSIALSFIHHIGGYGYINTAFYKLHDIFFSDEEVVLAAIAKGLTIFWRIDPSLTQNLEFLRKALRLNIRVYDIVPKDLKEDLTWLDDDPLLQRELQELQELQELNKKRKAEAEECHDCFPYRKSRGCRAKPPSFGF